MAQETPLNGRSSLLGQPETLFKVFEGVPRLFERNPKLALVKRKDACAASADDRILELQLGNALLENVRAVWASQRKRLVVLKHDRPITRNAAGDTHNPQGLFLASYSGVTGASDSGPILGCV